MPAAQPSLVGVNAKLQRADEHFKALNQATDRLAGQHFYEIVREYDSEAFIYMLSIRFADWVEHELSAWGLILGDAVHNYRSALDHLVYSLAVAASGTDPPPQESALMFPIAVEEPRFPNWRIKSLPPPMQTFIKRAQPYNRGNDAGADALARLEHLDVRDKHRVLQVAAFNVVDSEVVFPAIVGQPVEFKINEEPLEDGAMLVGVRYGQALINPADMKMDLKMSIRIALRDEAERPPPRMGDVINAIRGEVLRLVNEAKQFFPPDTIGL